jgi:hypothetical protein
MNSALPEFLTIMQDPNTESVARACRAGDRAGIRVSRRGGNLNSWPGAPRTREPLARGLLIWALDQEFRIQR